MCETFISERLALFSCSFVNRVITTNAYILLLSTLIISFYDYGHSMRPLEDKNCVYRKDMLRSCRVELLSSFSLFWNDVVGSSKKCLLCYKIIFRTSAVDAGGQRLRTIRSSFFAFLKSSITIHNNCTKSYAFSHLSTESSQREENTYCLRSKWHVIAT